MIDNFQKLKEAAAIEAYNLRINALPEERERLSCVSLMSNLVKNCIYSQLTGDCFGERALQLLKTCAQPVSDWLTGYFEPTFGFAEYGKQRSVSAIELYIFHPEANNARLVAYLKEEIHELTAEDL